MTRPPENDRPPADDSQGGLLPPEDAAQIVRGVLMGGADVIPGVSGGTVALILGIYTRLVAAISRIDGVLLGHLKRGDWTGGWRYADLRWLGALLTGIALGVALLGSLMHTLLETQYQFTMAAFFGLIAASTVIVARSIRPFRAPSIALLIVAAAFAVWLVRQPGLRNPPDGLPYVFFCGLVSICAMILPGISGSFILLILGKYRDITGIIKDALRFDLTLDAVATAVVFTCGCVIGLLSFSRLLRWLLARHQTATMSALCGFMLGSLWRVWPFQRRTGEEDYEHLPLTEVSVDGRFWLTLTITVIAAALVLVLDRLTADGAASDPPPSARPD